MDILLLQKPSKASEGKGHLKALEKRIDLWSNWKLYELLFRGETIQSRLHHITTPKSIGEFSIRFAAAAAAADDDDDDDDDELFFCYDWPTKGV